MLLVDHRQKDVHGKQGVVDEQEDAPLRSDLYPVADDCNKITHCEITGHHEPFGA